jgi:hypothetical protein
MINLKTIGLAGVGVAVLAGAFFTIPSARQIVLGDAAPDGPLPSPQMRRMTEAQYRNTISDVFSPDVHVVGRFEPEVRVDGLAAIGASQASISGSGYEQYYAMASAISDQVTDTENWSAYMPCDTDEDAGFDDACAREIVQHYGERLFRRSMSAEDLDLWVGAMAESMEHVKSFHGSVGLAVEGMLSSPQFLFIVDSVEPDASGGIRLTDHAIGTRLSYFLWNTVPDEELLRAADAGELQNKKLRTAQVERMLASDKLKQGAHAFYEDFLHLDAFATIEKDKIIYPAFNQTVAEDAREQVLKFLDYHLMERGASYPEIFTAKDTFMTRPLGMIYAVPVSPVEGWEHVKFAENDLRGGLLTHVGFTALNAHPGRSSATLRGIAVRELLLCQSVAPAPAAVNFTVVQETDNPMFKTARARLTQHRTDEACASCHKVIDPIGLAMENFDGAGMFRATENGAEIDTSGNLDGSDFSDLRELEGVLSEHEAATSCVVEKLQKFAVGRQFSPMDIAWNNELLRRFERSGYVLPELIRSIALSSEFLAVGAPANEAGPESRHARNTRINEERKS